MPQAGGRPEKPNAMTHPERNPAVDAYFIQGCGRCPRGGTPACTVHRWAPELALLREVLLGSGLKEELKWKAPCYTYAGRNVAMLGSFNEYCAVSFFKGVLLRDEAGLLVRPGENSQSARMLKFPRPEPFRTLAPILAAYIAEAVELEKAGRKVEPAQAAEQPVPAELQAAFTSLPAVKTAFDRLTPGRRRAYLMFFNAPKQSATRENRIAKCIPKILAGQGLHD